MKAPKDVLFNRAVWKMYATPVQNLQKQTNNLEFAIDNVS